jgi:hypothetical protein
MKKSIIKTAAERARNVKMRTRMPLVVPILPVRHLTIPADKLDTLQIGPYQRKEILSAVGELVAAMEAGGEITEPGRIARRPDGSLWIVDGHQRWQAHRRLHRPFPCTIYDVPDLETEMLLFTVFNKTTQLASNYAVNTWPGPCAAMVRELNAKSDSIFCGLVDLGGARHRPYSATILIKMMAAAAAETPSAWSGKVQTVMATLDAAFKARPQVSHDRCNAIVHLAARIFLNKDNDRVVYLPAIALGLVARNKWKAQGRVLTPTPKEIQLLSRRRWDRIVEGSMSVKYLPTLMAYIERRWKSS